MEPDALNQLESTIDGPPPALDFFSSTPEITGVFENEHLIRPPLDIFHGYIGVFVVAFLVTVFITPLMRKLAVENGIVDHPAESRKVHRIPIAYLGGVAVFLGMLAAISFSFLAPILPDTIFSIHTLDDDQRFVPISILLGMTVITIIGLWDDVFGLDPRLKVAGQLLAAAALAFQDVGVKVAAGVLSPLAAAIGRESLTWQIDPGFVVPFTQSGFIEFDLVYWTGTAIIAIFVLGGCNASNLIDGLDGLLTGVTAIAAAGLCVIALFMAAHHDGELDMTRIVLCLALLGACLGFLPHNFNPATIFLGDCGSLLLGYMTVTIILTLGDTGKTHFVVAGLIIYSIPIMDTVLAIIRRKLSGKPMSAADDQHLHHMLKRALGVKGAALSIYGFGIVFAALGVWLTFGRVRVVFTIAMVLFAFIGVTAVKIARRPIIEDHTVRRTQAHRAAKEARASGAKPRRPERAPVESSPAPVGNDADGP